MTDIEAADRTTVDVYTWDEAPRGARLRASAEHRAEYLEFLSEAMRKTAAFEAMATKQDNVMFVSAREQVNVLKRMLELVTKLEDMVKVETEPGWRWEEEVGKQLKIRRKRVALRAKHDKPPLTAGWEQRVVVAVEARNRQAAINRAERARDERGCRART